jgi:DDE_Tnp_1-associated
MTEGRVTLREVLAQVPDPRDRSGKRHPLEVILALAIAAALCGYKGPTAIAEWSRNYGLELARALGLTRETPPCAATFCNVLRRVDRKALEAALSAWAQATLQQLPPEKGTLEAVAIDGKTLRGSAKQGALDVHLLSVLSHRLGLTLYQQAVSDKTNEIGAIQEVLAALVLEGRVVTVDALLCQRDVAQRIVDKRGTPLCS